MENLGVGNFHMVPIYPNIIHVCYTYTCTCTIHLVVDLILIGNKEILAILNLVLKFYHYSKYTRFTVLHLVLI